MKTSKGRFNSLEDYKCLQDYLTKDQDYSLFCMLEATLTHQIYFIKSEPINTENYIPIQFLLEFFDLNELEDYEKIEITI